MSFQSHAVSRFDFKIFSIDLFLLSYLFIILRVSANVFHFPFVDMVSGFLLPLAACQARSWMLLQSTCKFSRLTSRTSLVLIFVYQFPCRAL